MTGLDLRGDTTSLSPTRMRRNDVIVVPFVFPDDYDLTGLDDWSCQVRREPEPSIDDDTPQPVRSWTIEIDPDDDTRVLVTYDATDLLGTYVYDVQDDLGRTLWGAVLIVDPDVSVEST